MRVRLIDGAGISLTGEMNGAVYEVTFTREGPHGLLYRIHNEWYAARRFKVVDDNEESTDVLSRRLIEQEMENSQLRQLLSDDPKDIRTRYWSLINDSSNLREDMWAAKRRAEEVGKYNKAVVEVNDLLTREVEGLRADVKAAEDSYTRAKAQLDQSPREVTGERLFEDWENKDLAEDTELWIWHSGDNGRAGFHLIKDIVLDQLGKNAWIVRVKDGTGELVFPYDNCIIKQVPIVEAEVTETPKPVKRWVVLFANDNDENELSQPMIYKDAKRLVCDIQDNSTSGVCVYRLETDGQMRLVDSQEFWENEEQFQ